MCCIFKVTISCGSFGQFFAHGRQGCRWDGRLDVVSHDDVTRTPSSACLADAHGKRFQDSLEHRGVSVGVLAAALAGLHVHDPCGPGIRKQGMVVYAASFFGLVKSCIQNKLCFNRSTRSWRPGGVVHFDHGILVPNPMPSNGRLDRPQWEALDQ